MKNLKVIVSGGGTGGHIFPAISIANALKKHNESTEILFVGARGKMEMEKVPAAGYKIIGLPISGFYRKLSLKNIVVIIKLLKSIFLAKKIIREFKPNVVVGVGGYASGALLYSASKKNIAILVQEQNSFPGITNRLLAKKANRICVAYKNMEKYFPKEKIFLTGNPVRADILSEKIDKKEAYKLFNLESSKKTVLVIGGSLGARTINESVLADIDKIQNSDIQLLWQTGGYYFDDIITRTKELNLENIHILKFISRMDLAYSIADLVISRAGAGTISELSLLGLPSIFVPSPNVTEDHQTKNANALVSENAALMVADSKAKTELIPKALEIIDNDNMLNKMSDQIKKLALKNSAENIAKHVVEISKS